MAPLSLFSPPTYRNPHYPLILNPKGRRPQSPTPIVGGKDRGWGRVSVSQLRSSFPPPLRQPTCPCVPLRPPPLSPKPVLSITHLPWPVDPGSPVVPSTSDPLAYEPRTRPSTNFPVMSCHVYHQNPGPSSHRTPHSKLDRQDRLLHFPLALEAGPGALLGARLPAALLFCLFGAKYKL